MNGHRGLYASIVALIAVCAGILWPVALGGRSLSGGDIINQYIPYKALVVEELRAGEFPHWNPLTFSGRPLQADIQVGVFYPPNLLFLLLEPRRAFDWLTILHFAWLALGALLFFRRALDDAAAALVAACVFSLSGFFASQLLSGIVLFIFAGAWLPWMLLACEAGLKDRRMAAWLGLGLAGAMQLLAGAPQIAFYSWVLAGAYVVVGVFGIYRERVDEVDGVDAVDAVDRHGQAPFGISKEGWLAWAGMAVGVATAVGLTAVQWMPTKEFLSLSFDRGMGASWEFVTDGSLQWDWLPTFMAPFLFQSPVNELLYWGSRCGVVPVGYWEFNGFCGVLAPALALAGFAALRRRAPSEERRLMLFAVVCFVLWAALAPGKNSPLFRAAYLTMPGFDRFRVPARWVLAYQLGLAIAAGVGWRQIASPDKVRGRAGAIAFLAILAVCGFALALIRSGAVPAIMRAKGFADILDAARMNSAAAKDVASNVGAFGSAALRLGASAGALCLLGLVFRKRRWGAAAAAVALVAILADVGSFATALLQTSPAASFSTDFYKQTDVRQEIAHNLAPNERWTWDDSVFDWTHDQNQMELFPNRPILYGQPTTRGYDPVNSLRYGQFFNASAGMDLAAPPRGMMFLPAIAAWRLVSLLNTRVVLSYGALQTPGLRLVRSFQFIKDMIRYQEPAQLNIYRNDDAVGPAFLARADLLPEEDALDPARALSRLLALDYPWKTRAWVEEPNPYNGVSVTAGLKSEVNLESSGYGRFRFRAVTAEPAVLVLTQSYYPGWNAIVDGEPRKCVPADWALTGVFLEPGPHEVEFYYRSAAFDRGVKVSLAALVLLIVAIAALAARNEVRVRP